jgi:Fuc2NAc and GlcNAc transferase
MTMTSNLLGMWLVLTPLATVGFLDDRYNLPVWVRYFVQLTTASLAIAYFGVFPQPWLTNFGWVGYLLAIVLTVIGFTAFINFYNFMDGLDGLVAGVTTVQLGFLALYLHQPSWWLLVAALLGFLWWNWSPAKIFMGDVGSTVLGACVAIALLGASDVTQAWSAIAVTFPLIGDAIYTIVRRLMRRENILKAHCSHLYQRLRQSGCSHAQVAIIYIGMVLLIASGIYFLGTVGAWIGLALTLGAIGLGEFYLNARVSPTLSSEKWV